MISSVKRKSTISQIAEPLNVVVILNGQVHTQMR